MLTRKGTALVSTQWISNPTVIVLLPEEEVGGQYIHVYTDILTNILNYFCFKDSCVKLWNLDALLSNPDHAKDALLATLSSHSKSVNVVRWSKDGKFLASGSDDQYILIHKYTPGAFSSQTFGSAAGAVKNKENWSR